MLDDYKESQKLFVEQISNSIKNNKINHAYLIDTNNFNDSFNLVLAMVKELFHYFCKNDNDLNNIYELINNNSYDNLIIINQENTQIKKEQILELQEKFSTRSLDNIPRIYIINNCDILNKYAANSLLKFLEEPNDDIIAILTTSNINLVIDTIKSRCQILRLYNNSNNIYNNLDDTITFIKNIEKYKYETIAYLPSFISNNNYNKNYFIDCFNTMVDIYENALRKKNNTNFYDFGEILDFILNNNDNSMLIYKLNILFETINDLNYNLNINIMLDRFIIEFSGGIND